MGDAIADFRVDVLARMDRLEAEVDQIYADQRKEKANGP
jgi:hypothetical protein